MFKEFMNTLDNLSKEDIREAKKFIKSGIEAQKQEIRDLKNEIKALKRVDKTDYRIDVYKNNIKWAKEEIKQMKKALWALRFAGVAKWVYTKWQQLKSFVSSVINRIKSFFGAKEKAKKVVKGTKVVKQVAKEVKQDEALPGIKIDLSGAKDLFLGAMDPEEAPASQKEETGVRISENTTKLLVQYAAKNFSKLNKRNPGLFVEHSKGAIFRACTSERKALELLAPKKVNQKPEIEINMSAYNVEDYDKFAQHVMRNNIIDLNSYKR